jgi:membrane glycosyltransferase
MDKSNSSAMSLMHMQSEFSEFTEQSAEPAEHIESHVSQAKTATTMGPSMPTHARGAMIAVPWRGFLNGLTDAILGRTDPHFKPIAESKKPAAWEQAAKLRRRIFLALIILSSAFATTLLAYLQPTYEHPELQWLQIALFSLLFAWVSAGCITAVMGFWVTLRGDKHTISAKSIAATRHHMVDAKARTAIIMPICNEDVTTVFAGLRATCESLAEHKDSDVFDVYILSDSSDPTVRAAEVAAWAELRGTINGAPNQFGSALGERIFYRWRQRRIKRKAGNVADFCRRWGRNYRYMIVLDADSVMSANCMSDLVRLMEANPSAGILQTAPQACGHATLHARAQQFASRVTGRLFTAGMQYWQLGEAHYWGHNAIIRVAPFMEHCALAPLSGTSALSGEILSHDFVEAALMRRAGFNVWLVGDLIGSYEQQPPHILAELQRDRRWCQGNLQNARLIAEPGLHIVHRGMLITGAMAYLSAPLWMIYVALGALLWAFGGSIWSTPEGELGMAVALLWTSTVSMLILPRVLGIAAVLVNKEQKSYGGTANLIKGSILEFGLSCLQAPLRMVGHTVFVFGALLGWKLDWKSPPREATDVPLSEATQRFAPASVGVLLIAALLTYIHPTALLWLIPVGVPLLLAIPFTVLTSRSDLGERVRATNLLLIPEEAHAPAVLNSAWDYARQSRRQPAWTDLLRDSRLCTLVSAAMGKRRTSQGLRGKMRREWVEQLSAGEIKVTPADRMRFLSEPSSLQQLRAAVVFPRKVFG